MNSKIVLFHEKRECCGCGACVNVCPKQAIKMIPDSYGFIYPSIDETKCIKCGKCNKVCGYQKDNTVLLPQRVYAASTKNQTLCKKSASGGIFATLAKYVIENNGVVFGAALFESKKTLVVKHISIFGNDSLHYIQGSKYVQSDIGFTYKEAEGYLEEGRTVLFSGTPCQVAGLKGYLNKEYDNLITVDIICHGVPSEQFFQDYLKVLMLNRGEIKDFYFRDKSKGWSLNAKFVYKNNRGKLKTKIIPFRASSYYDMFVKGEIYRENCYLCPFARNERIADLTLGDFWGIQKQHPEWIGNKESVYNENEGVSCVLINTDKGELFFNTIENQFKLRETELYKVTEENHQLEKPCDLPVSRNEILNLYYECGYDAVEKYFLKRAGVKIYYYYLKNYIPKSIKKMLKHIFNISKKDN